ncbi:MAG: DUF6345 domain-containing protein [Myxococcota bacterium]|jgi:hypothetical protein|nr:DUF6345 domain-containing protein [Myxococcota bacterium]
MSGIPKYFSRGKCLYVFIPVLMLLMSYRVDASDSTILVAAKGQESYQNDWLDYREYGGNIAWGFSWQCDTFSECEGLVETDLSGVAISRLTESSVLERTDPGWGADTVDIMYLSSHGGLQDTTFSVAMYEQNTRWYSSAGRFGDDAREMSVLALWSCSNMANDGGKRATRWSYLFRGGLRMAVGFIGSANPWSPDPGTDFANELHNYTTVRYAWHLSVDAVNPDHIPGYMVAGVGCSGTTNSYNNHRILMEYRDFLDETWPRVRDNSIGCYTAGTFG